METNDYRYVDLGLPSGTLWATCNVGAQKPTEHGLFFQWGDIIGYKPSDGKMFSWPNYKFYNIGNAYVTKYTATDKKKKLDLEDDAVHAHMGGDWRMPTREQLEELLFYRESFVSINKLGVNICRNKQNLFIPYAGYLRLNRHENCLTHAFIPSSNTGSLKTHLSYAYLTSNNFGMWETVRCYGMPIRGVLNP